MSLTEDSQTAAATATKSTNNSDDPEAIARRLREKIRSQAENLLRHIDDQETGRRRRNDEESRSSQASTTSPEDSGSDEATEKGEDDDDNDDEIDPPGTAVVVPPENSSTPQSTSGGASVLLQSTAVAASRRPAPPIAQPSSSSSTTSNELTKRLQQLALNRRTTANSSLRVIQADPNQPHLTAIKTFPELELPQHLLDAVYGMGFDRPSQIQEAALPRILKGRNVIGQAQSGSGKTAAFTLGMLYHCTNFSNTKNITTQAVCVCPTRELAIQIVEIAVKPMAVHMPGLRVGLAVAGSEYTASHILVGKYSTGVLWTHDFWLCQGVGPKKILQWFWLLSS